MNEQAVPLLKTINKEEYENHKDTNDSTDPGDHFWFGWGG